MQAVNHFQASEKFLSLKRSASPPTCERRQDLIRVHPEVLGDFGVAPVAPLQFQHDFAHLLNLMFAAGAVVTHGGGDPVVPVLLVAVDHNTRQVSETELFADLKPVKAVNHLEPLILPVARPRSAG